MRHRGEQVNMRLIIDCFKLVKGAGKSIGIYNLAKNLVRELAVSNNGNKIIILGNSYNRKDFNVPNVAFIEIPKNPLNKITCVLWELFEVSICAKRLKADKVLFPRGYASMLHLTKESIIIHDMIPFYYHENYPDYFNKFENFYIMWRLKASARKAENVITISQASKQDIIKYARVSENKINVIPNGYNAIDKKEFVSSSEAYILAITSSLPHKNAEGIMKSYERYYYMAKEPLPLKIVGIEDCSEFISDTLVIQNICCIKYVEKNEDFYQLIYGAKVFLFLSLIEGFGFPPIEAMQLETVTICSDISSLLEVAGDAAVFVNPREYDKVARALVDLLNDNDKCRQLQQKGLENIKRFSWDKTGEQYKKILFSL